MLEAISVSKITYVIAAPTLGAAAACIDIEDGVNAPKEAAAAAATEEGDDASPRRPPEEEPKDWGKECDDK